MPRIISNPEEVTAEWLSEVLEHAGISARVSSFTARSIGTGQVGENVRFKLQGDGELPDTVVGKFPSPDPVSRQTGIDTNNYLREVHFYNTIASRTNIQTPAVHFAAADSETHDFVIMMEDLAPGTQGDQLAGCDIEAAELAMEQLAHLHGPLWGDRSLLENDLISDRSVEPENIKAMYDLLAPGFIARYDSRLTDQEKQLVSAVGENMLSYMAGYQGEQTLVHIDYRLDNMMFGGPYPLAVVDWQSPAMDCALNDAAYFMGTSVKENLRQEAEPVLLRRYYDTLSGYKVDFSWDTCWHYYRHYAPAGMIMAVIASMIVGETPRGNDMFMAMAKRSARMCTELDAVDALKSGPQ